ncbi:MAG: ferredoxin, partial [Rhodothermales bacterium]|nr:ferredoxin [Rhodothermales bacterium]
SGSVGWDLVDRAVWAPDTFAAETSLSDLAGVQSALSACFDHQGPAVVGIYAPEHYLVAAAALEGRAIPAFSCAPAGLTWRERFKLGNNPTPEEDWSSDSAGTAQFSWADFAALLPSLSSLFLVLPSDVSDEGLVPAAQWLDLPTQERSRLLPYIKLHDADGEERKAMPASPVMTKMRRVRNRWRRLRELGGVSNSFEAAVRESMEVEQRAALEQLKGELESRHEAEMNQAVAGLAEEIVSNIARSLLGQNGSVDLAAAATLDPGQASVGSRSLAAADDGPANEPAKVETETEMAGANQEVAEEEPQVLDEAWVETVRCTSCNECTDLNGMIFAYDDNKQAYIKDAAAGPYRDLVIAAEKCPAAIIHPGKPLNPDEPHLEELLERAARFQ